VRTPPERVTASIVAILCSAIVSGCGAFGPGTETDTQAAILANVSGAVQSAFVGSGEFRPEEFDSAGRPIEFVIVSRSADPTHPEMLLVYRQGAGRPVRGRYELGVPDSARRGGFTAVYIRSAEAYDSYVATGGELMIDRSNADRIVGTFRFTATRFCHRANGLDGSNAPTGSLCRPDVVAAGDPVVSIEGQLTAVRTSGTVAPDVRRTGQ
jgi:hypothetical protein